MRDQTADVPTRREKRATAMLVLAAVLLCLYACVLVVLGRKAILALLFPAYFMVLLLLLTVFSRTMPLRWVLCCFILGASAVPLATLLVSKLLTILLDEGRVLQDGPSHQVIRTYLSSDEGTMASREWPDPAKAPGGEVARLRAVRVRTEDGSIADTVDIRQPLRVEMEYEVLIKGYERIISGIYSPKPYYERVRNFLKEYKPLQRRAFRFNFSYPRAFFKSVLFLGIIGKERLYYWKLFFWTALRRPRLFPLAITLAIYGSHFRRVFENYL